MLRPYQLQAVADLRSAWKQRPLLSMPTGGGKTHVACEIIRCAVDKGNLVIFVAHRRGLVYQARDRLAGFGIEAGIVMGKEDPGLGPVYVASVQTLARRTVPADVIIVDEAHHATSETWKEVIGRYRIVVGLSATPYRLDGSPLGDVFGVIVHGPTVSELIADGVLINPRFFAPPGPDLKGVHTRGGDYVPSELEDAVSKPGLIGDIVTHWKKHANGGRTVAFGVGIAHSKAIAAAFGDLGYHIDGSTPQEERDEAVRRLEAGEIKVLSNCDMIGEGWDLPSLDCAILARPTKSLALHRQQIGRVMRACPGKNGALILDHAGNTHRHGLPTDDVEVSLTGRAVRKQESAPRTCKKCFAVVEEYPCWCCGYTPPAEDREIKQTEGELVEFSGEHRVSRYREWIAIASTNGWKIGWAKFKYKQQFGVWPRHSEIDASYVCKEHTYEQRSYGIICARCLRKRGSERHSEGNRSYSAAVEEQCGEVVQRPEPVSGLCAERSLDSGGSGWFS